MSLADSLQSLPRDRSATGCKMGDILASLDDLDRDALSDALADKRVPSAGIASALRTNGHSVSENVVGHHRKGKCKCHR